MASSTHSMFNAQDISFNNNQGVNIVAGNQIINSNYIDERRDITLWLSPLNFKASQSQFLQIHEKGTCNWLLECPTFLDWRDGISQTLWCPGNPGVGKTILASVVVNHLQTFFKYHNVGIACIYCNYKEQAIQTVTNLIASLLKQFVQDRRSLSDNIKAFHDRHKVQSTLPTLNELTELLELEMKIYAKVFIVVDALDESDDSNGSRIELLNALRSFSGSINLMVTSRNLPSIEQYFREAERIHIHAADEDIAKYVQTRLACFPDLVNVQAIATKRIVDSVKGMFLLARLHINALVDQDSEEAVLRALDNLPDEIDKFYDEAMERIQRQTNTKDLAMRVLSWIVYATRPLSVEELRHALAISPNMTEIDERALVFKTKLTSVCAGLVVVDENIVRLAHYTTQQYFENQRESQFPGAEASIAATCLNYLSLNIFARGYCNDDAKFESLLKNNPLLDYAARNWGRHAHRHQKGIITLALDFLRDESKVECVSQVMLAPVPHWYGYSQEFPRKFSSVHIPAYWGLEEIFRGQLDGEADQDKTDSDGRTPLSYAAKNGHDAIVKLLLARGDVRADPKDLYGRTPLFYAARNGHNAVVELLLARDDVQADLKDLHGRSPLLHAVKNGHATIVKLLLARDDVQADSEDSYGQTPLLYAVRNGHGAVVKLLLARGDIQADLKNSYGRTPLSIAVYNGHDAVVKLLLARDDIQADSKDLYGRTPLSYAARKGYDAIMKLLLARDDVQADSHDLDRRTPLLYAVENGHDAVVKLLLDRDDVQVNSKDPHNRQPLSYAAENGHDAIVKLLLARDDIQVDSSDSDGGTPLSYAAENGHGTIVKRLLARDDVRTDSRDSCGRTPLSYAAENGHDAVVKLLLVRDDVHADSKDSYGQTPLAFAATNWHDEIIKLLLARDDVQADSKHSYGRTCLSYAAENGHDAIIMLLLAQDDVQTDSKDWYGRTPLSYAAENGHCAIVQLLLAQDDVQAHSKDSYDHTPLFYAAAEGHDVIVKLLLARDDVQMDSCG